MDNINERRYDIDWLRAIVMMSVFFFHCARFFGGGEWHLNNNTRSIVAHLFIGWLDMWFMPVFFLLSGLGAWYAYATRTNRQYILERIKRILIPLYTVGLFVMLPLQFYFEIHSNAGFNGTYWESLPLYFSSLGHFSIDRPSGMLPLPFSGHLWFLQYLILISLISLPLMRFLQSDNGLRFIGKLAEWCNKPYGIFICLIPILFIRIGLRGFFFGHNNWADFFEFMLYFLIGFVFTADHRFAQGIKKYGWVGLISGLAGFGCEGFFILGLEYNYPGGESFSLTYVLFETVMSIGRLSWIVFVLSLGLKYLNFNHKVLAYGNEAVLPFYIFHQTIILGVGWFVIRFHIGILPKFMIIAGISFSIIMTLYELLVRRFNVMRFCFGMRLRGDRLQHKSSR